jgi:iron complex outermembrane recepter protein
MAKGTAGRATGQGRHHARPSQLASRVACCACALLLLPASARAQAQKIQPPSDLAEASIEQLMDIEVTSVARKQQKLSRSAAAIYVITQDEIRRSGSTNIPDLLRMVPGVDVAQIQGDRWAISIRGFNDVYSNKVLVLIDGRTVYTPITSGVYWDAMDVPINDIERIEVIRGPGGSIWGANAVNGIINIITKSANETQGFTLTASAGSEEITDDEARYGGKIGKKGYYRVFGRYFAYGGLRNAQNEEAADSWLMRHGGFRTDWNLSHNDSLMIQGDIYQTNQGEPLQTLLVNQNFASRTLNDHYQGGGGDVLGRWGHQFSSRSQTSLQFYEMNYYHNDGGGTQRTNTIDFDFQHHLQVGSRQDIVWGLGYRYSADRITPGFQYSVDPAERNYSLYGGFFQDEIRVSDAILFTLGSRFEHNAFTGFEIEPSARLAWAINDRQTLWLAASKAIRQPSRNDQGIDVDLYTFPLPGNQLGSAPCWAIPACARSSCATMKWGTASWPAQMFHLTSPPSIASITTWSPPSLTPRSWSLYRPRPMSISR